MTNTSRELRRESTYPEKLLWSRLRGANLYGLKFRRQQAIGPFIADFFCHTHNLVIEIDGMSHVDKMDDEARQKWIESQGYRVIRSTNDDALKNLEVVLEAIVRKAGVQ